MAINRCKSLQAVLSQTRDVICKVYGIDNDTAFEKTAEFITDNSNRWRLPEPNIDYGDPFCRMAYLYMNVAVHAALVERALNHYPAISECINEKIRTGSEFRVCALGGGPGSELLGLVRYTESLAEREGVLYLDFVLVDRIKEWDESWHALKEGIDSQLRDSYGGNRSNWPIAISRSFLPLDATDPEDFRNFATRFSGTDLFIVCYLVSELKGKSDSFESVISLLVRRANDGALILIIDRDEKEVREAIQMIFERNPAIVPIEVVHQRGQLEDSLEDFGEWYMNIESLPRNRWLAFFSLARIVTPQL